MKNINRRNFIKKTTLSSAALAVGCAPTNVIPASEGKYMGDFAAPKLENIRAAFIGVGNRGGTHMKFLATLENTEVVAISDLYEDNVQK